MRKYCNVNLNQFKVREARQHRTFGGINGVYFEMYNMRFALLGAYILVDGNIRQSRTRKKGRQ